MTSLVRSLLLASSLRLAATAPVTQSGFGTSTLVPRDNNPNEIFYLTQCEQEEGSKVVKTLDNIFYSTDAAKFKQSAKPDGYGRAIDPQGDVPALTHIDWTHGTAKSPITATIGDKTFSVWDLDPKAAVGKPTGVGFFGAGSRGVDFRCYREDPTVTIVESAKNGVTCKSAFTCTYEHRQIRRTQLRLYNMTVPVSSLAYTDKTTGDKELVDPASVFDNLQSIIDQNKGPDNYINLNDGGQCKINFKVHVPEGPADPNYIKDWGRIVKDYFVQEVAPVIRDSHTYVERPMVNDWVPHYYAVYTYPQGGTLAVQVANQLDPYWNDQYYVDFSVACGQKCAAPLGGILNTISGTVSALNSLVEVGEGAKRFFGAISSGAAILSGVSAC